MTSARMRAMMTAWSGGYACFIAGAGAARAEPDAALGGAERHLHGAGELAVAEPADVVQQHGGALAVREPVEVAQHALGRCRGG